LKRDESSKMTIVATPFIKEPDSKRNVTVSLVQNVVASMISLGACLLPANAADRQVRLQTPSEIAKDLSAMPLIAGPVDDAERKINAAVSHLDASARKAAAACKAEGGTDSWWERGINVTMQGPRYLSYDINDNTFCGGAHPNTSKMSIVYDLTNGSPIDWTALLPPSLTGSLQLVAGADGTKMVTLSGRTLRALYLTGYRPRTGDLKKDADDDECRQAVADAGIDGASGLMVWLDAKQGGLVAQFDLAHADQACADSVTIPAAALKVEGAQAILVNAIEAAHAQQRGP